MVENIERKTMSKYCTKIWKSSIFTRNNEWKKIVSREVREEPKTLGLGARESLMKK